MIKNFLAMLGLLLILIVLTGGVLYERWKSLDKTAYEYAMDAASFVFANWDFQELKRRADTHMFANDSEEKLKNVFTSMSRLGALQSVQGCRGQPAVNVGDGIVITAKYACEMKFEKDTAVATLVLIGNPLKILLGDNAESWKILALNVNSDYLAKSAK